MRSRLLPAAALLSSLAVAPAAHAAAYPPSVVAAAQAQLAQARHTAITDEVDVRTYPQQRRLQAAVPRATALARRAFDRSLGRFGVVDVDRLTGTPRLIARTDGFLSGPAKGDPAAVALAWARAHADVVGLKDLSGLTLTRRHTMLGGATLLIWEQRAGGIPLFQAGLRAVVAPDGRIVSVGGSPVPALTVPAGGATLSPTAALAAAGATGLAPAIVTTAGTDRHTTFADGDAASLVLFRQAGRTRLAWRVWATASSTRVLDAAIDARTGAVLWRTNRVEKATGASWEDYVGAPQGGAQVAHPFDSYLTTPTQLEGNTAHVFVDADDDDQPDAAAGTLQAGEVPPNMGTSFAYPYTPVTSLAGNCPAAGCTWSHTTPLSWQGNAKQNSVQVAYFVNHFHDHLAAPPIGFDEAAGNFQVANATGKGKAGDPVLANTEDGAAKTGGAFLDLDHVDNANMLTPPDGLSPRMQMYLFMPLPAPFGPEGTGYDFADTNGGDDAGIIYHEYTHGLSNRLVLDPAGSSGLVGDQSGAMGEAWSDFYAADSLVADGLETDTAKNGELHLGRLVDGGNNLVRTEPIDCAVGAPAADCPRRGASSDATGTGGYTYADYGKVIGSPEVHADGEIWGQTLWDLRTRLIADHGAADGLKRARTVVTRAMELSPFNPSMVDMRNAILQADTVFDAGSDQAAIWQVFAKRGMGYFASAQDGSDTTPAASTSLPPAAGGPAGAIVGSLKASDGGGALQGATAALGGHNSGFAGDFTTQTGADGTFRLSGIPAGTYPDLILGGLGYDRKVFTGVKVTSSGTTGPFDAAVARDWAAILGGAQIQDQTGKDTGCGPTLALDQSVGTAMEFYVSGAKEQPDTKPRSFVIRMPAQVDVDHFGVDPGPGCGDDATSALADLKIETSVDGKTFAVAGEPTFDAGDQNVLKVITPAAGTGKGVRFVRLTLVAPQGTDGLQGDPTAVLSMTGSTWMDLAQFEVRGSALPGTLDPPKPPAGTVPAGTDPTQPGGGTTPGATTPGGTAPGTGVTADKTKPRVTGVKAVRRGLVTKVSGRVSDNVRVASVTVHGRKAKVTKGRFAITLRQRVKRGRTPRPFSRLSIVAKDAAGNTLKRTVVVKAKRA